MTEIAVRDADVAVIEPSAPVTLFRTENPQEVVQRASEMARELAKVVRKQKLTVSIQGREHCRVEAWTLLGTMLGVFPICQWTRKVEDGWEARVEARTLAGHLIGAAEAQCLRAERTWKSRDDYALRSMAQTRATSKALRQPLGFVMTLAGFDATPAEEMPVDAQFDVIPEPLRPSPEENTERALLVQELLPLAERLGKLEAKAAEVAKSRTLRTPEADLAWLRSQLAKAKDLVAALDADS